MSEILMNCPPYPVLKFYIINVILTKFDYIFIIRYLIHDEKHFHYNIKFYELRFYVNCWGEIKVLTPNYYIVWFSFRRECFPFSGRRISLIRLKPCGVSTRRMLTNVCQN